MRRIKTLLVLLILAMAVMSGPISNRNQTRAADFRCTTATCPGQAQCSGDYYTQTGCAVSCYKALGLPGQIVLNGTANCSPPPSGGGGGGGGGGLEEFPVLP
jgi:hypothetical protein